MANAATVMTRPMMILAATRTSSVCGAQAYRRTDAGSRRANAEPGATTARPRHPAILPVSKHGDGALSRLKPSGTGFTRVAGGSLDGPRRARLAGPGWA